jgi:hypothetical protein
VYNGAGEESAENTKAGYRLKAENMAQWHQWHQRISIINKYWRRSKRR